MVRLSLLAAAAIFATVRAAPLDVIVHQAQASASPTHSPQLSQPIQPSQTSRPTQSATPDGSNAPTSPTPSNTASPAAPSASPSTGAPASSVPTAVAPDATPAAPTPAGATPAAPTPAEGAEPADPAAPVEQPTTTDPSTAGAEALEMAESPMATPDETPAPFICFPGDATVQLESGSVKRMDEVAVGDRVAVGSGKFSEVFMFTHKLSDVAHEFISIKTKSGETVRMTEGHYLPVNGKYVPAREAKVGDIVTVGSGTTSIVQISTVSGTGLFNPQTAHGDIVVDGVLASTYTTAVERKMAHALLAPFRLLSQQLGLSTAMLNSGNDFAARFTSVFA